MPSSATGNRETLFGALRTVGTLIVGGALTVTGIVVGGSFKGSSGSDTIITTQTGKDIVYQLAGTEVNRITSVTCTATGGQITTGAGPTYDTCYMPSPLSTTGALKALSIQCGNVKLAMVGDVTFVKGAKTATGSTNISGMQPALGTGSTNSNWGSGITLWNPADKIKFASTTAPTGTLSTTRYDCVMRAEVEDLYGR